MRSEKFDISFIFTGIDSFRDKLLRLYFPKFEIIVFERINNSYGTLPLLKFVIFGIRA